MITHPLTSSQMAPWALQKVKLTLRLLGLCTLALSLSASAQKSTFTTFDPPGSAGTFPASINSAGVITGFYYDANFVQHGFLRSRDATFTTFDASLASINAAGEITGTYNGHGFLRSPDGNEKESQQRAEGQQRDLK